LGSTDVEAEVYFFGVVPETSSLFLSTVSPVATTHVQSGPGPVLVKPSGALKTCRSTVRPASSAIRPGGERDLYMDQKRVYELILDYNFKAEEDGNLTLQAWLLNDRLYESIFESQLLQVYDSNKKLVAAMDAWPTPTKFKKGDYVARLQVRHDDVALLERLKHLPLGIDKPLAREIPVKAYGSYSQALTGGADFVQSQPGGVRTALFFAVPFDEKVDAKPGDVLLGTVSYGEPVPKAAGKHSRGGFTVQYAVCAGKPEDKKPDEPKDADKLKDALRDVQVKHLEGLRKWATKDDHAGMLTRLQGEFAGHLPLAQEELKAALELKAPGTPENDAVWLKKVVEAAGKVVASVNLDALAQHAGRRIDSEDKAAVRAGKDMDKQKAAVIEALSEKVLALAKLGEKEELVTAYKALGAWVDVNDTKYSKQAAAVERAHGRLALALAAVNKQLATDPSKRPLLEERIDLLQQLGWEAWAEHERKALLVKFPKAYSKF